MLIDKVITIPAKLHSRLRTLAKEDQDLLQEDQKRSERCCLRSHHERIWQKLRPAERKLIKKQNPKAYNFQFEEAIGASIANVKSN
mgnify:CR=1 FL=1